MLMWTVLKAEDWDDEEDLYHKMKDEELGFLSGTLNTFYLFELIMTRA